MLEKQINRNAIITAAGVASRLVPLSFEKHKAFTFVRGEILIERIIRQMREADIQEIVVVVGYLKEQFEYLVDKFGVILVENPNYSIRNTHFSLYCAKDYLKNTIICPADEYFTENIFLEPSETSYYALNFVQGPAINEWCTIMDSDGRIIDIILESEDCWIMADFAYLVEECSAKLIPLLKEACENDNAKDWYWEDILLAHLNEIPIHGRKYQKGVVQDFDSLSVLQKFDDGFMDNLDCKILNKIFKALGGRKSKPLDIQNCTPIIRENMPAGMKFTMSDDSFEYWHKEQIVRNQATKEEWAL